jgi:adenosylmethionine-8-amino-7-oxononanoate aminotransferase
MRKDWLHFYQMDFVQERSNYPKIITQARGCYIIDQDGKSYFDSLSGAFCVNLGYDNMDLLDAGYEAAKKLHFASPFCVANNPAIELADNISNSLIRVFNQESQVFFTNSGSEAIDTALKIALAISRKRGENRRFFISMDNSYHGTTFGATSISSYPGCRSQTGNLYPEVLFAPNSTSCVSNSYQALNEFLLHLPISPTEIAGWIIEPTENQAGNSPVPQEFMTIIDAFCKKYGILLIIDEVITGFGRLGYQWGIEEYAIEPDILVSAKGLTSGYESLGATAVKKELETYFRGNDDDFLMHGATFGGRPAACAIANKVFALQTELAIFSQVKTNSKLVENRLLQFDNRFPFIRQISGKGLLWSIHFSNHMDSEQINQHITEKLCTAGVFPSLYQSRKAHALEFAPPLIATEAELNEVLDKYQSVLENLPASPLTVGPQNHRIYEAGI